MLHKFGPKVARWMFLFMVCGCGMFVSASAFLPSSFAMCFIMIALGAWFLDNYPVRKRYGKVRGLVREEGTQSQVGVFLTSKM